jgi:hypothetical protein
MVIRFALYVTINNTKDTSIKKFKEFLLEMPQYTSVNDNNHSLES